MVVIPAFNESGAIGTVVRQILRVVPAIPVVVVDDGSSDDTSAVARAAGARVLRLPFNMGYGVALQTGYKFALREGYDCVVQMDADGQHEPADIPALLDAVTASDVDIALGSRFLGDRAYRPALARRLGMRLFAFLAFAATGIRFSDVTSGFQALTTDVLRFFAADRYPVDYPDADVLIMLSRSGFTIAEVPVRMYAKAGGASMHTGLRPFYYVFKMVLSVLVTSLRREAFTLRKA